MLRGELVDLRAVERADGDRLWRWLNDPELMRAWGLPAATVSRDLVQDRLAGWLDEEARIGRPVAFLADTLEGEAVGLLLALPGEPQERGCDLSLFVADPERRRQGIGTDMLRTVIDAAFEQWGAPRVAIRAEAENAGAVRLYVRLGFRREGCLRRASFFDGEFHDVLLFSLLPDEPRDAHG